MAAREGGSRLAAPGMAAGLGLSRRGCRQRVKVRAPRRPCEKQDKGTVLATKAVGTHGKDTVLATTAVGTQGQGTVLATTAVGTQCKGSASPPVFALARDDLDDLTRAQVELRVTRTSKLTYTSSCKAPRLVC